VHRSIKEWFECRRCALISVGLRSQWLVYSQERGQQHAYACSPQLLQLLKEQKREGGVVAQPQKIRRETLPVRKHALVAADFYKRVKQTPANQQLTRSSSSSSSNCKPPLTTWPQHQQPLQHTHAAAHL
jgi:hypothetical protein